MTSPSVYDHYRTTDDYMDGIYRVVGIGDEEVTLLRVGEADGRRINTGEVITVTQEEVDGFEQAENPDGNRPLSKVIFSAPETAYWSVRAFVEALAARPIPAVVALGILLAGYFGEGVLPIPDLVLGALVLVGGFCLAYVGSGRL